MAQNSWRPLLACPHCRAALEGGEPLLTCGVCSETFTFENEVAWFLGQTESERARLSSPDGQAMVAGYRQPNSWVTFLRKIISSEYFPGTAWRKAKAQALEMPGPILIVGSGITRYERAIHLDLDDFPGVDLVADAHAIPLQENSVDAVVCEVVLEHANEPMKILAEVRRVLKPGGRLFFVVPFVFPYHGHPSDYRRWSREGLAQDFHFLDDLDIGVMGGPCSSMVNLLSEWAYVLTGLKFPKGYTLVKGGATALLFPLKFLDLVVNQFPEAHRLASTLYVAGQMRKSKSESS